MLFVNAKIYHIKTISIALYRAKIGYSLGCSLQSKNTTVYRATTFQNTIESQR